MCIIVLDYYLFVYRFCGRDYSENEMKQIQNCGMRSRTKTPWISKKKNRTVGCVLGPRFRGSGQG